MTSKIPEIKELKSLLQKTYGENIEIIKCETKSLTAPGENYGSVMLAVDVTLKIENEPDAEIKHFVAKLLPISKMLCDWFNIQVTFKKEMNLYQQTIPALQKFEEEFGIKENEIGDMFATCIGGRINLKPDSDVVDNDACLLLENLNKIGYECADRLIGFDLAHAKMIIKNLAKFHAVPIALRVLKPQVFNAEVLPNLEGLTLGDGIDDKMTNAMVDEVLNVLKTEPKCTPYLDKIIESIKFNLIGPYRQLKPREPFATFVHTDYWVNNTMILTDSNGKPIHNKIVDLQVPVYTSCAFDLLFFIYSSIAPSALHENIDNFLKLYYDSFINSLKEFNLDISMFSWEAFQTELSTVGPLEIGHILAMFKPILMERGQIKDMADFDEDEVYRTDQAVAKDYESRMINTVLSFIERKWI